jgi:bacteriocin-like protein
MIFEERADVCEILKKEDFLEKLKGAKNDEEVQKLFADYGATVSLNEIAQMVVESAKVHEQQSELNEEQLNNVTGGVMIEMVIAVACLGFFTSYGYHRYIKR